MADLKKLMLDEIRKNTHIQSSYIDETEELIDTGLDKNEDNLNAVALAYLDEKGYRSIAENVDNSIREMCRNGRVSVTAAAIAADSIESD